MRTPQPTAQTEQCSSDTRQDQQQAEQESIKRPVLTARPPLVHTTYGTRTTIQVKVTSILYIQCTFCKLASTQIIPCSSITCSRDYVHCSQ